MATSGTSEGKQNHNIAGEAERHYGKQYHLECSAEEDVMSYGDADAKEARQKGTQAYPRKQTSTADLKKESLI